jgi:hypothetical protein
LKLYELGMGKNGENWRAAPLFILILAGQCPIIPIPDKGKGRLDQTDTEGKGNGMPSQMGAWERSEWIGYERAAQAAFPSGWVPFQPLRAGKRQGAGHPTGGGGAAGGTHHVKKSLLLAPSP